MTEVYRYNYDSMCLQIARDFVSLDSIQGKDYLFYPHHDYSFDLVVGDIDFDSMSWEDASLYRITTVPSTAGVSGYRALNLFHYHDSDSLSNPYNVVVYGSGDNMPHLVDRGGEQIETASLFAFVVAFLSWVIFRIFDNVSRR